VNIRKVAASRMSRDASSLRMMYAAIYLPPSLTDSVARAMLDEKQRVVASLERDTTTRPVAT
jgi:hypothetical protein